MTQPLLGINVALALRHTEEALQRMDDEATRFRGAGFNLDPAGPPMWDRATWEAYRAQFGAYPFSAANKPPGVLDAPAWVKKLCGVALTPAERMGQR